MKRVIQFTKARWIMITLSLLLIAAGVVGIYLRGGFNLGIDFTSGLTQRIQIRNAEAPIGRVREALSGIDKVDLQYVGDPANQEFIVKVIAPGEDRGFQSRMEERISELLAEAFGEGNIEIKQSDFVGPRYSRELVGQTISIILVALLLILLYTGFRFHFIYATAAVICLVHDVLIMFGVIGIFQLELTTTTIAAVLTIIGYSLNDTIVIFDRIRENRQLLRDAELGIIINTSITQSLSRTLLTSITTLLAVAAIYAFASGTIKLFALNLIIGVVVGTYSTIFIASPIVLGWQRVSDRRRKRRDLEKYGRKAAAASPPEAVLAREPAPGVDSVAAAASSNTLQEGAGEPLKRGQVKVTRVQPAKKKKKKKKKK